MALQEVGVEAVVKGVAAFQGELRKMTSSLQGLQGQGTLLQRAFGAITDGIIGFGESVARVAETALGVLLRDAINAAIGFIRDLISATIDAGNEFQTLEIRLERLNFNDLVQSGMDYNKASETAIELTKEQLKWLQLLAAQSPYDATDVANTYTLARSYGFADQEARGLTETILNFAAGMGLTGVEIKRIIINFGQMVQQGKVTQREMNDLARGAFVPVNDVLKVMSEQTGVAMDQMDDFRKTGESVGAFMRAFTTLVQQRFSGAVEQMSNTFKAATGNVLDLVKGIFGLNTVKPVLDVLGKAAAQFANAFTDNPERWDRVTAAATRLGNAFADIVQSVLDLLPSTESIADAIVTAIDNVAQWVEEHKEDIVGFFAAIGTYIQENILPALQNLANWFTTNWETIVGFAQAVWEIFSGFVSDLLGGIGPAQNFGNILVSIMQFVIDNKDAILKWIEVLWKVFVVWQVVATVLHVVVGIVISVIGFILSLIAAISGLIGVINIAMPILTAIGGVIGGISALIALLGVLAAAFILHGNEISTTVQQLGFLVKITFSQIGKSVSTTLQQLVFIANHYIGQIANEFENINWFELGRNIIQGIADGITSAAQWIIDAARRAAQDAYDAAAQALGVSSPSKMFFKIGTETMAGMALGIQKAAGLASVSMQGAMSQVASNAVPSVTNSTVYNNTSNYNLTVNSAAQQEPLMQDFTMMQSLAGVSA